MTLLLSTKQLLHKYVRLCQIKQAHGSADTVMQFFTEIELRNYKHLTKTRQTFTNIPRFQINKQILLIFIIFKVFQIIKRHFCK